MAFDIFLTLLLVSLNGFFVSAEFAIVKVRASQLEMKAKTGHRLAGLARHIVSHLDNYLAATQLGVTFASLGLGWIGEPVVSKIILKVMEMIGIHQDPELAHRTALPIAFIIITILHIVFGELAPKSVAILYSEKTTMFVSYPLQLFYLVFRPFIWVLNGFSRVVLKMLGMETAQGVEIHSSDELKYLVEQGKESGVIKDSDYAIIKNAFDFSDRTAYQIMVPRTEIVAVNINTFDKETLERLLDEGYSRIPCFDDDFDHVVGMLYLKDLLQQLYMGKPFEIRSLMWPVMFVHENKRIGQLLKEFQLQHQQIAVVINEYGGTSGIVTMEDILEELVGEIQDEYDQESPIVEKTDPQTYVCIATAPVVRLNEHLPRPLEVEDLNQTLISLLILRFGRLPNVSDKITINNYEVTIMKKSRNTIRLVQLVDLDVSA